MNSKAPSGIDILGLVAKRLGMSVGGFMMDHDAAEIDIRSDDMRLELYQFLESTPVPYLSDFRELLPGLLKIDHGLYGFIKLIDFVCFVDDELGPLTKNNRSAFSIKDDHRHNLYMLVSNSKRFGVMPMGEREVKELKAEYLVKALNVASGHGDSQQNLYGAQYHSGLAALMEETEPAIPALLALVRKARTRVVPVIEMRRLTGYISERPDDLQAICAFLANRGFFDRDLMDSALSGSAPAVMNGAL